MVPKLRNNLIKILNLVKNYLFMGCDEVHDYYILHPNQKQCCETDIVFSKGKFVAQKIKE